MGLESVFVENAWFGSFQFRLEQMLLFVCVVVTFVLNSVKPEIVDEKRHTNICWSKTFTKENKLQYTVKVFCFVLMFK